MVSKAVDGAPPTTRERVAGWSRAVAAKILGVALAFVLRLASRGWRSDPTALARIDSLAASGRPVLAVFWHGKYLPLFSVAAGRNALAFASSSLRGMVVAEICRQFGYQAALLPERGGGRSREVMRRTLQPGQIGAFAIDGPLGPYHVIKSGVIDLAAERGGLLVPLTVGSSRKLVLRRRWDLMEIPYPFARLTPIVGEPIEVPPRLSEEGMASVKRRLREELELLDARAEALAKGLETHAEGFPEKIDHA